MRAFDHWKDCPFLNIGTIKCNLFPFKKEVDPGWYQDEYKDCLKDNCLLVRILMRK